MMKKILHTSFLFFFVLSACHNKQAAEEEDVSPEQIQTPVTVTGVENHPLEEHVDLNATASFLQSSYIKSSANGYISAVNIHMGEFVAAGQNAFVIKTKEAQALGNTINSLDSSFHFSGVINIHITQHGYITELTHQAGDYVQDGEQLAVISDSKSFGFVLNLPYELRRYISVGKGVQVFLPDSTELNGVVASFMPTVDSASQTQQVLIKVDAAASIPQNLIATVRIIKNAKPNAQLLPKEAVLADEAQTDFWVMKMIDSVTAVKVPVQKGLESDGKVEIISPAFNSSDKILLTGNYGLNDTAKVKIVNAK